MLHEVSKFRVQNILRALRYTGGAAFLITFGIAVGHTAPELYRSVQALDRIEKQDLRDLSLTSDLQYQMQKSSDRYSEVLRNAATRGFSPALLAQVDKAHQDIDGTVVKLRESGVAAAHLERFTAAWYKGRDLAAVAMGISEHRSLAEGRVALSTNGSQPALAQARAEIQEMKLVIQESSHSTIAGATAALRNALIQLGILLGVTLACGALFTWLESRHRRMLSQLEEAHRSLNESEERFQRAYEEASVGMALLDLNGHLLVANRAMSEIMDVERRDLIGKSVASLLAPEERDESAAQMSELVSGIRDSYRAERRVVRKDGKAIWTRNSVSLLRAGGEPAQVFVIAEDVTERRTAFDLIEHQATHDGVTSLPNRFRFEEFLRGVVTRGTPSGLLYLDLDGFKLINDTLGHAAGDEVLNGVGKRLRASLSGPEDLVARLGGDEFAIVITGCEGRDELALAASKILQALETPFPIGGKDVRVGATIGIAVYPEDGTDPEFLLQSADAAMYEAKRAGRNRFSFFTPSMRRRAEERMTIESNLRHAMQRSEFYVVFQPLFDVRTGGLARFEALCRWRNPVLGEVSPVKFIPAAEESGLIVELGRFVLNEACRQARHWAATGSSAGISVNVSAIQFSRQDFLETVKAALAESGLDPCRLQLELTESVFLKNIDAGVLLIERLRDLGVSVSIDDFGTGYSSLSYLQKMPVHSVKIDRSFVADVDSNAGSVSMIRSVIALARAVGLSVVTEGVETRSQLELLTSLGCDEVQGFLLGRPESADDAMERVLRESSAGIHACPRELTAA